MIKPLTSLRFLFAMCVFLSHYSLGEEVIFPEGYIGVSFFFILSGFIISYNYKRKFEEKTISAKTFIAARIARIYPLHLAMFLFVLMLTIRSVIKNDIAFPWKPLFFNAALLQSFIPVKSCYFSFNAVSWSISDELFFYFAFPIVIVFFTKIKRKILLILGLSVLCIYFAAVFIVPEQYHHALFYIHPFFRIIDFIIGIEIFSVWKYMQSAKIKNGKFLSFLNRKDIATIVEVLSVCLLVVMICVSGNVPQVYRYASYYWIPMALIILCFAQSNGGGILSQVLSWKPFVIAGEISFGFYMLHQQMIGIGRAILARLSGRFSVSLPAFGEFVIILTAVLAASLVSFYFFERPANKLIKNLCKTNKVGCK